MISSWNIGNQRWNPTVTYFNRTSAHWAASFQSTAHSKPYLTSCFMYTCSILHHIPPFDKITHYSKPGMKKIAQKHQNSTVIYTLAMHGQDPEPRLCLLNESRGASSFSKWITSWMDGNAAFWLNTTSVIAPSVWEGSLTFSVCSTLKCEVFPVVECPPHSALTMFSFFV